MFLLQHLGKLLSGWGNAGIQLLQVSHQLGPSHHGWVLQVALAERLLMLRQQLLLLLLEMFFLV
jgi:hypothetical protein